MITNINLFYVKITRWKLIGSIIFSRTVYTSFKRTDIISAQFVYIVQCAFLIIQIYFSLSRIARGKALRARQDNRTIIEVAWQTAIGTVQDDTCIDTIRAPLWIIITKQHVNNASRRVITTQPPSGGDGERRRARPWSKARPEWEIIIN